MKRVYKAITFRASSIGDCLMGKYLLENVHAEFPDARCGLVVSGKGDVIRNLLQAYPWIEVIEANRRNIPGMLRLLSRFFWSDFVVTQYTGKGGAFGTASKLMARAIAKPGALVGFRDAWKLNAAFYDHLLPFLQTQAVVEHERDALRAAGIPASIPVPTFSHVPQEGLLERFGLIRGGYAAVHLFSGGIKRGLSPEKKKELARLSVEAFAPMRVAFTGTTFEEKEMREATEGLVATMAVCQNPQELAGVLEAASGVVSLDTGAAHLSAQMQKPLVVLATCMGRSWWVESQYPQNVAFFSREDLCIGGHVMQDYPVCLNEIDLRAVLRVATSPVSL